MREDIYERLHRARVFGQIAAERFMLGRAAYGGLHHVPAIMYRLARNRYRKEALPTRPSFAYERRS